MSAADLDVQPGTVMWFLATEWFPKPRRHADHDQTVIVDAVYRQEVDGRLWVRGHVCGLRTPQCGTVGCWEHQVRTSAIRANLAGER